MLDLLFFAAVAAFLAFRFYNTIGKKDHSPDDDKLRALREMQRMAEQQAKEENVIELRPDEVKVENEEPLGKTIEKAVKDIQKLEPDFDHHYFMEGAKRAFEMIITAFAEGDKSTLKNLLSDDLYKEFEADIDAREKKGQSLSVTLVSGPKVKFKEAQLVGKEAEISLEFDSREIRLLKDEKGRIVEGDPSDPEAVKDLWTFTKKLDKKTKIWKLTDTEAL